MCIITKTLSESKELSDVSRNGFYTIYFSGTGNSRYVAEMFCNEYDETTKALSIEDDNIIEAVRNEEMLVFAYPVQYNTVPKILRDFIIENKELWENKKVFVIATMGLFSGDGAEILGRLLQQYGAEIIGELHLKMPDSIGDEKQGILYQFK